MRQEAEDAEPVADADDHDLLADDRTATMSLGPPARLLPPWIQTSTGSLPRQRRRADVERQAILAADDEVAMVPALVVLEAGRAAARATRGRRVQARPAAAASSAARSTRRRGERDAAEQQCCRSMARCRAPPAVDPHDRRLTARPRDECQSGRQARPERTTSSASIRRVSANAPPCATDSSLPVCRQRLEGRTACSNNGKRRRDRRVRHRDMPVLRLGLHHLAERSAGRRGEGHLLADRFRSAVQRLRLLHRLWRDVLPGGGAAGADARRCPIDPHRAWR